jgi:DNA-binding transcriptional LysR family regulator
MTILQIKYFMEAARRGNFTDVARSFYVAQPAVTKQVHELEKELGFPLFVRKARGVELTKQGEIIYMALLRCEEQFESALRQSKNISAGDSRLVIGLQSLVELSTVSAGIHAFMDKHQEVDVEFRRLSLYEIYPALEKREIDLAVVFDTSVPENGDFEFYRLFPSGDFIITAKNSPLAEKGDLSPEDLKNIPIVQERPRNSLYSSPFGPQAEICSMLGFQEKNVIWCDNYETCLATVEHGNGVMVIDALTVFPNKENFCRTNALRSPCLEPERAQFHSKRTGHVAQIGAWLT